MSTVLGDRSNSEKKSKKVTTSVLQQMKVNNEKIAVLTAYDYSFARLIDQTKMDVILVGDSASNVMAGHSTTIPITLDQMIYHAQCVVRAIEHALVIVDMPFGTYQGNSSIALASAIRMMKEGGAHGIKIEGGEEVINTIKIITQAGIPIMGHLGLTPQSIYQFGSFSVRAKEQDEAKKLIEDAILLEKAGCFAIVLEKIPAMLAKQVTDSLRIPTIGIGAGKYCNGQVLVMHDLLGMNASFKPKFLRQYAHLDEVITSAVSRYIDDVKKNNFPNDLESY
ncbi:MAG: 3-methyl-2-oxobutanoate hydroxymethyltransferase [Phycisphaerales bacterium]|nr:3-methyl-2-oxobutanoate hydroxymethyltransferase [Phycisphaerales bacterium]